MRRRTLALVVVAFAVRIAAIAAFGFERVEFGDARDYLDTAGALCATGSYPAQGNLPFFRAPGLPFFIAAVTACHPQNVVLVKLALTLVDSLTVALIVALSFALLRSPAAALLAGLAAAFHPLFIVGVTDIRTEPLFMFFFWSAATLVAAFRPAAASPPLPKRRLASPQPIVLAGACLAMATLTRPVTLIFVPLFLLATRKRMLFALGFVAVLLPWTARNYARYGEVILINNAGGYSLWRGTHPEMARIYDIDDRDAFHRASIEFEEQITKPATRKFRSSAEWRDDALANIRKHPRLEAKFALKKALLYWRPWLNPQEYSTRVVMVSGIAFVALYALAILGFARMPRTMVLWIAAFFVLGWLAHIPHQVVARFRYPLTDPLLLIAAAYAIVTLRTGAGDDRSGDTSARPTRAS